MQHILKALKQEELFLFNTPEFCHELRDFNFRNPRLAADRGFYLPANLLGDDEMYNYCVESFMEDSAATYYMMLDQCLRDGVNYVIDVGCALGIQSMLFTQYGVNYIGVDGDEEMQFYDCCVDGTQNLTTRFLHKSFPFKFGEIDVPKGSKCALISNLCIFWCDHTPFDKAMKALKTFPECIMEVPVSAYEELEHTVDIYWVYPRHTSALIAFRGK